LTPGPLAFFTLTEDQFMLILSGKIGSRITIDGGIEVTVVEINAGKIKLGFTAPIETKIMRNEVLEKIKSALTEGVQK